MRNLLVISFYIPVLGLIYGCLAIILYQDELVEMIDNNRDKYPMLFAIWLGIQVIGGVILLIYYENNN